MQKGMSESTIGIFISFLLSGLIEKVHVSNTKNINKFNFLFYFSIHSCNEFHRKPKVPNCYMYN